MQLNARPLIAGLIALTGCCGSEAGADAAAEAIGAAAATGVAAVGAAVKAGVALERRQTSEANASKRRCTAFYQNLKAKVIAVESTVRDAKAVTDDVTRWKLMGLGALGVTGFAAASLASLVTYYWHKIVAAITG